MAERRELDGMRVAEFTSKSQAAVFDAISTFVMNNGPRVDTVGLFFDEDSGNEGAVVVYC
jgi:hypothetical protein